MNNVKSMNSKIIKLIIDFLKFIKIQLGIYIYLYKVMNTIFQKKNQ